MPVGGPDGVTTGVGVGMVPALGGQLIGTQEDRWVLSLTCPGAIPGLVGPVRVTLVVGDAPWSPAECAPACMGVVAPVSAFRLALVTIWWIWPTATAPITTIATAAGTAKAGRHHGPAGCNRAHAAWYEIRR